jgi:hypothetical protein
VSLTKMESGLLLNVVIGEGTAILELFSSKDQTLLIGRDPFLVLDLVLDVVNRVTRFDLEGDRFARKGLDEDLHPSTKTED